MRVFAGPNGSGKSTVLGVLSPEWIGIYINADEIEKLLKRERQLDLADFSLDGEPGPRLLAHLQASMLLRKAGLAETMQQQLSVTGTLVDFGALPMNSYIAAAIADFIRRELLDLGESFTFETVMSHPDKVEFMREARKHGYRTYLYFVATESPAINIARVHQRVGEGGHAVPEAKIVERYARSIELLAGACEAASRAYIFDNSGEAHVLIAEVTEGDELTVHADTLPGWFTRTTFWASFAG